MTDDDTTTAATSAHALALWMKMWNTGGELALQICSDDFRIHFGNSEPDGTDPGDLVRTAEDFSRFLDWYRREHPDYAFREVSRAVDGARGRLLWNIAVGKHRAGGIDVFDFAEDGSIREVWSVAGTRPMSI